MESRQESVPAFFALIFILTIPFWVLGAIKPIELLPGLPISALGAFIPAMAALILVYKIDRLSGVLQLMGRSFDFKRVENKGWILAALLIPPAVAVLAYVIMSAGGELLPKPAPFTFVILPMFVLFFISALGEEIGWSGYAVEPLQRRWGILAAGLVIGVVWAVWHFISLTQVHRSMEWIAWWSLHTIALRMIIIRLYNHAGKSVFVAAVFHAMINVSWQLFPNNGSYYDPRVFGLITLGLAIVFLAAGQFPPKNNPQPA